MRMILGILLGFVITHVAAGSGFDEDKYKKLQDLYAKAAQPKFMEYKGWLAGKCYRTNTQGSAIGGLIAFEVRKADPLFPSTKKIFLLLNEREDFFINLPSHHKRWVQKRIDEFWPKVTEMESVDNSLRSTNLGSIYQYRIRLHDQVLLGNIVYHRDYLGKKKGATYAMCYFFKKLR